MPKGNFYASRFWQRNERENDVVKVTLPFNVIMSITDPGAANGFGTAVIGDLPVGDLIYLGSALDLKMTSLTGGLLAAFAGNIAVGTDPTADATLSANEITFVASTTFTTAAAGISALTRYAGVAGALGTILNNRNNAMELNLNAFITDATLTAAATLRAEGVLHLAYIQLGTF